LGVNFFSKKTDFSSKNSSSRSRFEPIPSLDSRLALKTSFSPKAPKPIWKTFSSYNETLFIGVPFGLKIVLKYLNPSQIDGNIQTKTIKTRKFFHYLLYLGYLLCKLPYLILKFKYGIIFYGETKDYKGLKK